MLEFLLWHRGLRTQLQWPQVATEVQVPSLAQCSGFKDPALLQLWCRLQLPLKSDPWPGNSMCHRATKMGEKKTTTDPYCVPKKTQKMVSEMCHTFILMYSSF